MKIVKQRSTASGAVAAVPVPGVDVAADIEIILEVIGKINKKFGLSSEEIDELDGDEKQKIAVLITSVGSDFAGAISYGTMYTLRKRHVEDCFEICERILKEQNKW